MMNIHAEHFYVLTGGPGSGKSTLIDALRRAGYATTEEAGRAIIRDQSKTGGRALPWADPRLFAETMLRREICSYRAALRRPGPVFFDRGVPDIAGYLSLLELPVPQHMRAAAETFRYNRRVFVAPPWRAIYRQDEERRQSFAEAARTCESMIAAYTEYGYDPVALPCSSVAERVGFVLETIGCNSPASIGSIRGRGRTGS